VKRTARSASSHSSAFSQEEPCAENTARRETSKTTNLGIFKEKCNMRPGGVQGARFLIIRPGALGDTLLSLPALRALQERYPRARLDLVGYPAVLRLAELAVRVDTIHSIDRAIFSSLFGDRLLPELRALLGWYDLVIAWVHDPSGHLEDSLRNAGTAYLVADPFPGPGSRVHASSHLLRTLASLDVGEPAPLPPPALPSHAHRESEEILGRFGLRRGGFIAVHPGSGSPRKNWPPQRFAAFVEIARRAGKEVVVVEGEADREAVEALSRAIDWRPFTVERLALPTLAALLTRAEAYVGNDSGVSHLAAWVATPTLALFGPTDPAIWAPRGARVRVLSLDATAREVWESLDESPFLGT
jgi:ADP-heptose:LPS heptosyltransferase